VRIEGTHGLEPQALPENAEPLPKPPASAEAGGEKAPADASPVPPACRPYVQAALAADDVDHDAVEAARKLLQSGELDTPEAILRAARAMLDKGV